MSNLWIIGGTTEGRRLAETLASHRMHVYVSVVSDYGSSLLEESEYLTIMTSRMGLEEMERFLQENRIDLVLDASHPYAAVVTQNARMTCERQKVTYQRIIREESPSGKHTDEGIVWVDTVEAAVEYLQQNTDRVFVTTGSKELGCFTKLTDYKTRVYARVLPDADVLSQCRELGITGKHLIAMQGPFSKELNLAMFHATGAGWLVTKEAGIVGGFQEKIEAALDCNMRILVIGRPGKEEGISVAAALKWLGVSTMNYKRQVACIGIGMGNLKQLTLEAAQILEDSDVVLGASRLLDSLKSRLSGKELCALYQPEKILAWLDTHREYETPCLLFSGDTGFYSGASKAAKALIQSGRYEVTIYPGISSLAYLCASQRLSWEDVCVCSLHGREDALEEKLASNRKVFVLLGGEYSAQKLLERLIRNGHTDVKVTVGERLSYPEQRVVSGTPTELVAQSFDKLCVALIVTGEKYER